MGATSYGDGTSGDDVGSVGAVVASGIGGVTGGILCDGEGVTEGMVGRCEECVGLWCCMDTREGAVVPSSAADAVGTLLGGIVPNYRTLRKCRYSIAGSVMVKLSGRGPV